jgi:cell division protein FtsN
MEDRGVESGLELVLDNKKLIIAFLVLISVCCFFFVFGFVAGKRQGIREGTQSATPVPNPNPVGTPGRESPVAAAPSPSTPEPVARPDGQSLGWYKNASQEKTADDAAIKPPPQKKAKEAADKAKAQASPSTPVTYSVQVGAFRQKHEAEIKAQSLKSKGFDYRIESPDSPQELYHLKVGKFSSRADAVAMQIQLKKSGFASFIKTN